jgi:hypothetical protein
VLADRYPVFRNNSAHSRQLRGAWWPVGLADKASFYNVLANSRLYMLKEVTGAFVQQDDALSLSHQNAAFRAMADKMHDSKQHDSDELLGCIASFMCHHVGTKMQCRYHGLTTAAYPRSFCGLGASSQRHVEDLSNEGWR